MREREMQVMSVRPFVPVRFVLHTFPPQGGWVFIVQGFARRLGEREREKVGHLGPPVGG